MDRLIIGCEEGATSLDRITTDHFGRRPINRRGGDVGF